MAENRKPTLESVTAYLKPYQAYKVKQWHAENVANAKISSHERLGIRPECFRKFPEWERPTPEEVKIMLNATGLKQNQASVYLGLKGDDGRAFRRYTGGESAIPYACWVMLCLYVGIERFW